MKEEEEIISPFNLHLLAARWLVMSFCLCKINKHNRNKWETNDFFMLAIVRIEQDKLGNVAKNTWIKRELFLIFVRFSPSFLFLLTFSGTFRETIGMLLLLLLFLIAIKVIRFLFLLIVIKKSIWLSINL